jgi:hypothetical protein
VVKKIFADECGVQYPRYHRKRPAVMYRVKQWRGATQARATQKGSGSDPIQVATGIWLKQITRSRFRFRLLHARIYSLVPRVLLPLCLHTTHTRTQARTYIA